MTLTARPVTYGLDASIAQFSADQYQRMVEVGILTDEDKVELLENYVVLKFPRTPLHDGTLQLMNRPMFSLFRGGWLARTQAAVVLSDSLPEPDWSVVRGNSRSYLTRHPEAADVGMVIEVADLSLLRDQQDKARIYARATIPHYWIINLVDGRIEVYSQPSGPVPIPAYGSFQTYQPGESIPLVLDGSVVGSVAATDLLP